MLSELDIEYLLAKLALPEKGRALVQSARTNSPVRNVSSHNGNCVISFFSRKMGNRHLELESRTVEAPAAMVYEDDPACLEFWPQPFRVDLTIKNDDGQIVTRTSHTPDFLLIRGDGIWVHEWRDEHRLLQNTSKNNQFYKDKDSRWHYKAAEDYFSETGLRYELHSAIEQPRTYVQNIRFLEDYYLPTCLPLPVNIEANLQKLLSERGSIPFTELIHDHDYNADDIFKAITKKIVFVDLYNDRLDLSSELMIHRDNAIAKLHHAINNDLAPALPIPGMGNISAGTHLIFNGNDCQVLLVGGGNVLLKNDSGESFSLSLEDVKALFVNNDIELTQVIRNVNASTKSLADFSHKQLETSDKRLAAITSGDSSAVSTRTLHRWKAKIVGSDSTIEKVIALVDRNRDKGNRVPRLPEEVESLAEEVIRLYFNTSTCRTPSATYRKYHELCDERKIIPMSFPTFTKRVKSGMSIKNRKGNRKAYQEAPIPLLLDYRFPVNGVRPHEVCYIDHTITPLATIGPDGSQLGKPTFTIAVDGNTTQIRAMYLSYDPPSANVVLMTLRDYVRRNNRLPRVLIVDGGKEFRSKELELFCRYYEIELRHRPPHMPRGGSPVESAIGATEIEIIAQLEGNTRAMKDVRMVTKSVNPYPKAAWTLTALYGVLEEYLFEDRNTRIHPTLGSTPRDYEAMRMLETGQREHVLVKFDENIMLMTTPHTKRRLHIIDRKRGVWADNSYYWHDEFRVAKIGEKVEVRSEPWLVIVVYVYFRDHWIAAIARDLKGIAGRTRREVEIARRTERRLAKTNSNRGKLYSSRATEKSNLWIPDHFDERIGKQQREMQYLYSRLGMTVAMSEVVSQIEKLNDTSIHDDNTASSPSEIGTEDRISDNSSSNVSDIYGDAHGYH